MEPRELWERNTLLAEAFCSTDDQVRETQAVLDEALASRTRALAAFAVTVGSDGAVADLLGLSEREVRVARRTVGKDDARTVAEQLLSPPPEAIPEQPPVPPAPPAPPAPLQEERPPKDAVSTTIPLPRSEVGPPAQPPMVESGTPDVAVTWTAGMDSVLQWSWQSGLDLQAVAEELGLSPKALLVRAQTLATEGRLSPKVASYEVNQAGRHRRHESLQYSFVPDSPEHLYERAGHAV
ncbi:hypothetical protein ACFWR9_02190 [Streptomyces sp. NPDC058534]|uniref:hypothetical protein n=1 Tax=Streptomyces sp. NPDC058534 TaxID=3346541 RepID=UPI0036586E2F